MSNHVRQLGGWPNARRDSADFGPANISLVLSSTKQVTGFEAENVMVFRSPKDPDRFFEIMLLRFRNGHDWIYSEAMHWITQLGMDDSNVRAWNNHRYDDAGYLIRRAASIEVAPDVFAAITWFPTRESAMLNLTVSWLSWER
jgi:hypothetical protein